jgi:thiamine kinase
MSGLLTPEEALSRIPGWTGGTDFTEIGGGLTNRSFLVRAARRQFVLRLDAQHTATFGIDRAIELKILQEAAKSGLAPEVHFADPDAGILLYEYLAGPVWKRSTLDDPDNLELLAALLRKVHSLPASGAPLDVAAAAACYADTASRNPGLRLFSARCVAIVRAVPAPQSPSCCHNDVIAANIIGNRQLRLLDWEYARDNDPFFDLASLIGYHDLGNKYAERLLDAYHGSRDPEAEERLKLQLRLFDAIQWLWLAARYVIEPNTDHLGRLEQLRKRIA